MNVKRIVGFCLFVIGVYIIFVAVDAIHQIAAAKGLSQSISDFFQHNPTWNPIIKFFGGQAQEKINRADTQAIMALVAGIILTTLGAVMAIIYRKPKN